MNTLTVIPAAILAIATFMNGETMAADGPAGPRMCPATTAIPTAADRAMAEWRKQRALYLHDLRLSSLAQRETMPPGKAYDLGTALVEADLYLSYAEADGLIVGKTKLGRDDLNKAVSELKNAETLVVKPSEKAKIESFRKTAIALNRDFDGCMNEEGAKEREGYQDLRRNLARLIKQTG